MFDYPPQAQFQRTLPKSKIYEFAKPRRAIRDRFVSQVAEIIWQYKLSPETTNLAAAHGIHEIQIFQITLKTGDLHDDVLRTIDQAIPSPIIFNLIHENRQKTKACLAHPSWAGPLARPHLPQPETRKADFSPRGASAPPSRANQQMASQTALPSRARSKRLDLPTPNAATKITTTYYETEWQPLAIPRPPLPIALHLAGLYEQIFRHLLPIPARPGESLRDHAERTNLLCAAQAECRKLEARLQREVQFNRQVEVNAAIRARKSEIAALAS